MEDCSVHPVSFAAFRPGPNKSQGCSAMEVLEIYVNRFEYGNQNAYVVGHTPPKGPIEHHASNGCKYQVRISS